MTKEDKTPLYRCFMYRRMAEQINYLNKLIDLGLVDLVFQGHNHNYQRTYPLK